MSLLPRSLAAPPELAVYDSSLLPAPPG